MRLAITAEQKRKRLEREKVEEAAREARREAASRQRKVMHDMAWLVFNTADRLAPQMTISPAGLLEKVLSIHHGHTHPPMTTWPQYSEPYKALDDATEKANGKDRHLLSCKLLIARELGNTMSGYRAEEQFDWPGALEHVKGLAESWGLKLPSGWDQPPIHKTRCNCHVCGKFTSQDHITKVDEAAGWVVDTSFVADGFVTCSPKCRDDEAAARLSGFSERSTKAPAKKPKLGKSTTKRGKS